jgi:hypothetical protein
LKKSEIPAGLHILLPSSFSRPFSNDSIGNDVDQDFGNPNDSFMQDNVAGGFHARFLVR